MPKKGKGKKRKHLSPDITPATNPSLTSSADQNEPRAERPRLESNGFETLPPLNSILQNLRLVDHYDVVLVYIESNGRYAFPNFIQDSNYPYQENSREYRASKTKACRDYLRALAERYNVDVFTLMSSIAYATEEETLAILQSFNFSFNARLQPLVITTDETEAILQTVLNEAAPHQLEEEFKSMPDSPIIFPQSDFIANLPSPDFSLEDLSESTDSSPSLDEFKEPEPVFDPFFWDAAYELPLPDSNLQAWPSLFSPGRLGTITPRPSSPRVQGENEFNYGI